MTWFSILGLEDYISVVLEVLKDKNVFQDIKNLG